MVETIKGQTLASMSDAEFLNIHPSQYGEVEYAEADENVEPDTGPADKEEAAHTDAIASPEEEHEKALEDGPESGEEEEGEGEEEEALETESEETDEVTEPSDNFKKQYEELFAPFKANGAMMEVTSVEEARRLMQQGANYGKKMQGIAPHMKTIRTLAKEGISGEELNYLIDLRNKVPAAINKLVHESGIDPHDLDSTDVEKYTAQDHQVTDSSMKLVDVLENIQESPYYNDVIELTGKQWDHDSKTQIGSNPIMLEWINDHMANGVYPIIKKELDSLKLTGGLAGLNDLQAYQQVGANLHAQGKFDHLVSNQGQQTPPAVQELPPKQEKQVDPKLRAARKAAANVAQKAASKATKMDEFDIANLSDEDFMAQFGSALAKR